MIRCARIEDLPQIAQLHFECFPDSFSTVLGKGNKGRLLENYYYEYLSKVPELFLISENENKEINGLCMGYYCEENNCLKMYFKHNLFRIGFRMLCLLLSGNKLAWKKVLPKSKSSMEVVDDKVKNYEPSKKGDLLSICVKTECRGASVAKDLVNEFVSILQSKDREFCVLSVKDDNDRAVAFYKKMGFGCYMKSEDSLYMAKVIE